MCSEHRTRNIGNIQDSLRLIKERMGFYLFQNHKFSHQWNMPYSSPYIYVDLSSHPLIHLEPRYPIAQADPKLAMQSKMTMNSWPFFLHLPDRDCRPVPPCHLTSHCIGDMWVMLLAVTTFVARLHSLTFWASPSSVEKTRKFEQKSHCEGMIQSTDCAT